MSDIGAFRIEVVGHPAPKGSARAINRGGFPVLVASGSDVNRANLRSWDQAVKLAAKEAVGPVDAPPFVETAIRLTIVYRVRRPSTHWGKKGLKPSAPAFPIVKPDMDKYTRATCDSLKGIVYDDDARIVERRELKMYAAPGREGATIIIEAREPLSQTELSLLP